MGFPLENIEFTRFFEIVRRSPQFLDKIRN